jgi:2-C-methyl-D-erythritol 4-phosphate cytidylyltransferase/2-C-methyl-D-erythritol 2,4-cyclodiphosphate synthase
VKVAALIVAAGSGSRYGGALPKQYVPLLGRPVLRWTIEHLRAVPAIGRIQLVIHPDFRAEALQAAAGLDLPPPVAGGATRQDSVLRGLEALAADPPDIVLIHDAARPLVDRTVVETMLAALAESQAVLPALPVADALQRANERLEG